MAGIRQNQIWAVSYLAAGLESMVLVPGQKFFVAGKEVVLGGVCKGVGTCCPDQDQLGKNFAVFLYVENSNGFVLDQAICVDGAVLLRDASAVEASEYGRGVGAEVLTIEALIADEPMDNVFYFMRTGEKKPYVSTIC